MSRTILLADDSVTIQKVIELTFMEEDYEVVAAGDGDEALERLDELRPDFVIADVHMPGASGLDVCRRSKQLHPEIPVLLLVGTFEPFDEGEARSAGADAHLKKPFDSQELLQLVDDLMGPEGAVSSAAAEPAAAEPAAESEGDLEGDLEGDSTWGFDVGDDGEPAGEPEPVAAAYQPEAEPAEPASDDEVPETAGGDAEWQPLESRPAEVTPPAVGQVEAGEPAWERSEGDEEPAEEARAPFELGEVEPRRAGGDQVFDLGADEDEGDETASEADAQAEAEAEPASAEGGHPAWGFSVGGGEAGGEAAAGGEPGEDGPEDERDVAAAGFRWDETDAPGSLVAPPDVPEEQEPAAETAAAEEPVAYEPEVAGTSDEEPSHEEPEAGAPASYEPEAEEPLAADEEEPFYAAEPEAEEPRPEAEPVPGSGASYGAAEVVAPIAAGAAAVPVSGGLSEGDVERIARRVAELVGDRVTREVAWEVVPDLAEVVIRERLRELEGQID